MASLKIPDAWQPAFWLTCPLGAVTRTCNGHVPTAFWLTWLTY